MSLLRLTNIVLLAALGQLSCASSHEDRTAHDTQPRCEMCALGSLTCVTAGLESQTVVIDELTDGGCKGSRSGQTVELICDPPTYCVDASICTSVVPAHGGFSFGSSTQCFRSQ